MVVVGAGGFAKQLIDILVEKGYREDLVFFDNTPSAPSMFLEEFEVVNDVRGPFQFCLGLGGTANRKLLFEKFIGLGGEPVTVISPHSLVSHFSTLIGEGATILSNVIIEASCQVGKGTLINVNSAVTHDSEIGDFCELGPGVTICGRVRIGSNVFIGAGATVLPDVRIGNNVIIGAGSLVTRNIDAGEKVKGVPAKPY